MNNIYNIELFISFVTCQCWEHLGWPLHLVLSTCDVPHTEASSYAYFFFCKSRRRLRNKRFQLPRVRSESWILEKVWKIEIKSGKMVKSLPWATLFSLNFACIKFCEKSWAIFREYLISRFFRERYNWSVSNFAFFLFFNNFDVNTVTTELII